MKRLTVYSWLRGVVSLPIACAIGSVCAGGLVTLALLIGTNSLGCAGLAGGPLVLSAVIDAKRRLLPDPLLALAGAMILVVAAWHVSVDFGVYLRRGLLTGGGIAFVAYLVHRFSSLGLGDVKLLGVIGLWIADFGALALTLALASFVAAFQGIIARRRHGAGAPIPLGPALVGSACAMWLVHLTLLR